MIIGRDDSPIMGCSDDSCDRSERDRGGGPLTQTEHELPISSVVECELGLTVG